LICAAGVMAIVAGDAISQTAPTVMPASQPASPAANAPFANAPAGRASAESSQSPYQGSHPSTTQISFDFENASVDAVLQHLSDVAGFIVLKDTGIGAISGRVSVMSKQSVTPDEAVALLNTVLKNSGYTAIRMGGRILKIVSLDKAKKSDLPVKFGADPLLIEPTDDLVTWVIPVRSVDAVKLKTDLAPLIPTDADISANAGSNTIIITDTQANIRRVVEIIAAMDKRDATQNTIRVKQLKYADATAAAKLINDIFNPTTSGQTQGQSFGAGALFRAFGGGRGGGGGFGGGGGPGGAAQSQSEEQGNTGKVTASSDARTNTVVVTGPEDTLAVIDTVLTQLDANPASEAAFFIYRVKNGQSADMATTLNALFSDTGTTGSSTSSAQQRSGVTSTGNRNSSGFGGSSGGGGGAGGSSLGSSSSSSSGSISRSFNTGGTGSTGGGGGNRGGGGGSNGSSATASAISELEGQVNVVADTDTNSLLVACAAKYQDQVKAIIDELDRPVQQVLIKCLIASVTHDNSDDLGLDFSVLNMRPSGNGQTLISNLGNAAANTANGGLAFSVLEKNLSATFHALASQGKMDVLSRPYILASDNQESIITVGQEVPFITNSTTNDLGNIINTIQYQSIGIILDVTPHLNPDGLVILDVSPQISSQSDQSVQIQAGINAPVFNNTSASSRVGIRDGDTIVIGGLMQDQLTQTITKIPLLGDIPYVGSILFGQNSVTKTKQELLIFLTPHVAPLPEKLQAMSRAEMRGLKLVPNAVEPGTFQEHLQGMRLGGSTTAPTLLDLTQPTARPDNSIEPSLPGDRNVPNRQ
jgi:general secretion pathway protein D